MGRVTCVGLTTLDVVQSVARVPGPDEKVVAADGRLTFGGPAANAAATVAALGVPVRLVTALGTGAAADLVRRELAGAGVEVVDLAPAAADLLPVSTVLLVGARRAVVSRNATAAPDLAAPAARLAADTRGDVLLVDGHHLGAAVAVASAARRAGATVLLDGGSWKPGLAQLLALVDVAVLSADFRVGVDLPPGAALAATDVAAPPDRAGDDGPRGDVLDAVHRLGPSVVARSAGAGPVEVRRADGTRLPLRPAPVAVVDTLGAGDVLHGAVAAGLACGAGTEGALRLGVAVATLSVQHTGALGWTSTPGHDVVTMLGTA